MKPSARIEAVIQIMGLIEGNVWPADRTLAQWYRHHRFAGSKDRALISNCVYGILRMRAKLVWAIANVSNEKCISPRALVLAYLLADGMKAKQEVINLFDSSIYGPAQLSRCEVMLLGSLKSFSKSNITVPDWVKGNMPEWLFRELKCSLGEGALSEALAMQERPALDLRVNTIKSNRDKAILKLQQDGIVIEACSNAPDGLRVIGRSSVRGTRAFRHGLVEIMDEGSQIAAKLVEAEPGETIIDLCAGAGGKSLALAADMANRGLIHACDNNLNRLSRMNKRLIRAGVGIVKQHHISSEQDAWFEETRGKADRVLVDAPCTGIGTARRNPDLPWRISKTDLLKFTELQTKLLDQAAPLVKPGGRIVYVTCSLLKDENTIPVEAFLAKHSGFRTVPVRPSWEQNTISHPNWTSDFLMLTAARHSTDGFFIAILKRQS